MASLKFILTNEKFSKKQIKLVVSHRHQSSRIATGIYIDVRNFIPDNPHAPVGRDERDASLFNDRLYEMYREYDNVIYELTKTGQIRYMRSSDIHGYVEKKKRFASIRSFWDVAEMVMNDCSVAKTKDLYRYMLHVLRLYCGERRELAFESIDPFFLEDFIKWMDTHSERPGKTGIAKSTQAIILRHMRAIYNKAIAIRLIDGSQYPFKSIRFPRKAGKKEYMSIDHLRTFAAAELTGAHERARDLFMLSFYLCGTNPIDIWNMLPPEGGYIRYERRKTCERNPETVTMRLLPEAAAIVERWKGKERMMDYSENYATYESFYASMRHRLDEIARDLGLPPVKLYSARRTWATYAIHEDVPEYVVDKSLQHADTSVAAKYYITYDWRKTDKANRRVRDFVLSDRAWEEEDVDW